MTSILRAIILLGLLASGVASVFLSPTASADIAAACNTGAYTGDKKTACEAGYNTEVSCGSLAPNVDACEAGRAQSVKDKIGASGSVAPTSDSSSKCGGAKTEIISCDDNAGLGAIASLIKTAILVVTVIIGIVAVGGITFAAIQYASAQDNQNQVSDAINMIRNIVIGLLLYGFSVAIINWLIPGGVIG